MKGARVLKIRFAKHRDMRGISKHQSGIIHGKWPTAPRYP